MDARWCDATSKFSNYAVRRRTLLNFSGGCGTMPNRKVQPLLQAQINSMYIFISQFTSVLALAIYPSLRSSVCSCFVWRDYLVSIVVVSPHVTALSSSQAISSSPSSSFASQCNAWVLEPPVVSRRSTELCSQETLGLKHLLWILTAWFLRIANLSLGGKTPH